MKRVILFAPLNVMIEIYIIDQIFREHTFHIHIFIPVTVIHLCNY